jgi:predicted acetylornithine/succinylornithine family transaminase
MKSTATPAVPERIQDLEAAHIVPTYARAPVAFVRGEGVWLVDADGRRYLDLLSGIGVASLGHGHPGLAAALAEQARTLAHTSNLYYHPLQGEAAARLAGLSGLPRVFFTNSGTEAVEACLKFARRYWVAQGRPDRTGFVALHHGFAGRTMGSLSVTWEDHYRAPFQPLVPGVTFVDPADPTALEAAVTGTTAAIIAEPIQGEGGVRPLPPATAAAIARACDATGTLLIADEVQCGLGRTGAPFAFPSFGLRPDLVSVGKAIGGGMPVGAALVSERVAAAIRPGDHGSTYGGNLLACRAALFVLEQLVEGGLLDHVGRVGSHLASRLRELAARHAAVREVRGRGLMWGLELDRDAAPVVAAALERGLVVNRTAGCVIRLLPPYVITEDEIDEGLVRLDAALEAARGGDA